MMRELIGNTPLVKINYKYKGKVRSVYAKMEYYNLTGSIKDRIAYYMLNRAIEKGELENETPIIEATSGNTGISIAAIGAYLKRKVVIFMPDWVSEERAKILKMYGAEVHLYSKEEGGFKRCIEEAKVYAEKQNGFLTNQFSNLENVRAHEETTGKEILEKITPDGFISGIGTGGTLMGIGQALRLKNPDCHIWALEPKNMSILKTGVTLSHKIDGIGDEFVPEIVDTSAIEDILLITDEEALETASMLARNLGLGVGISSGANFLAAVRLEEEIGGKIVTVFPDDLKKYISSDLGTWKKQENLGIELLNYEVL
jgi:cysteine synthase A